MGGPSGKVCSSKSAKPFCGLAMGTHHSQSIPRCERLVWKKGEERVIPEEPEAHTGSQDPRQWKEMVQDTVRPWHGLGVPHRHTLLGEFGEVREGQGLGVKISDSLMSTSSF